MSLHSIYREQNDGRDINVVYNKNHQLSLSAEHFLKIVQEVYPYEKRKK